MQTMQALLRALTIAPHRKHNEMDQLPLLALLSHFQTYWGAYPALSKKPHYVNNKSFHMPQCMCRVISPSYQYQIWVCGGISPAPKRHQDTTLFYRYGSWNSEKLFIIHSTCVECRAMGNYMDEFPVFIRVGEVVYRKFKYKLFLKIWKLVSPIIKYIN